MKELKEKFVNLHEDAYENMKIAQMNNAIQGSYIYEGQAAVYELIVAAIDEGESKANLRKLVDSLTLESQERHRHSHIFSQICHEEGRLIALSVVKRNL